MIFIIYGVGLVGFGLVLLQKYKEKRREGRIRMFEAVMFLWFVASFWLS